MAYQDNLAAQGLPVLPIQAQPSALTQFADSAVQRPPVAYVPPGLPSLQLAQAPAQPLTQLADQAAAATEQQKVQVAADRLRAAAAGQQQSVAPVGTPQNPIDLDGGAAFSANQLRQAAMAASQRYVPGRAAITPQDIQAKQEWNDKGLVATQGSEARVGASPEAYQDLQKIQEQRQEAIMNQSIADKLQAGANLDAARANAIAAQQMHEQEAAAQAEREAAWNEKYQAFQEKYNPENDKVDPGRFFKRAGVLGSAMAIIGAGLEASAAARRGTSNPQTVMRLIDNDIRSQEADIRTRGMQANNQLTQLSREWGSIENGKQALRALQLNAVGTRASEVAAKTNDPAIKAQIDAHAQAALSQSAEHMAALKAQYGGQVNEQRAGVIMRPQEAVAGGVVTDRGKLFQNMVTANKSVGDQQELAIKAKEAGSKHAEQAQGHAQQAATALAPFEAITAATDATAKSVGLVRDQTGKWVMPAKADNPLRGAWDATAGRWSDKAAEARANLRNSTQAIGRALSGAAISEDEQKQFIEMLPSGNMDDAARMNALETMVEARKQSLLAGAGVEGAKAYNTSKQALGEMRKTQVTGGEEPYKGRK